MNVFCIVCCVFLLFFKGDLGTLLLFLLLLQFVWCILGARFLVFCALFPLAHSLLRLIAGGSDNFLALRAFGLLFLLVLFIFAVSLVSPFLLLPVTSVAAHAET